MTDWEKIVADNQARIEKEKAQRRADEIRCWILSFLCTAAVIGAFIASNCAAAARGKKVAKEFSSVPAAKVVSIWVGQCRPRIFLDRDDDGKADYSAELPNRKIKADMWTSVKSGEEWLQVVNPVTMRAERE